MSGWPRLGTQSLVIAATLAVALTGCARSAPLSQVAIPTAEERNELEAAYTVWRRAVTCATTAAPRPVPGAEDEIKRSDRALHRAVERGLGPLLQELDVEYRRVDARVDWSCGDGDQLAPPGFESGRLNHLRGAIDRLVTAIETAIGDQ